MSLNISNELWRKALVVVQNFCEQAFKGKLEYSTKTLDEDHGCPPPIHDLQPDHDNTELGTDTVWNGSRMLWCTPANPNQGAPLKTDEKVSVACLGTTLWNIIHALKLLGIENEIPNSEIQKLKKLSLQEKYGIAKAFVELDWARGMFNDPNMAQGGDVGVIGYGNNLPHHWFVVAEEPHLEVNGHTALNTWAASPSAEGAGYDYWYKDKEDKNGDKRYWILARPFS